MGAERSFRFYNTLCLLMVSFVCSAAQAIDVAGNWEGEIQTFGAKSLKKSIAMSLEQTVDGKVKGHVFYDDDACIIAVEGRVPSPGINRPSRVDLLFKATLTDFQDGCQHQRITHALGLTPAGDSLQVGGNYLHYMIHSEKSIVTRQPENRFAERLRLLEKITGEEKRKPKQWSGAMNRTLLRFLFPAGYASPNHVYVFADELTFGGLGKCKNVLYSQEEMGSNIKYISHDPECDILPAGRFDISIDDNLKITWRPESMNAKEIVLLDQDVSLVYQSTLSGEVWHLQDVYNQYRDTHTMSQIATTYLGLRQEAYQYFDAVIAQNLPVSDLSPKFIGAWQGFIRISNRQRSDEFLEQVTLALWLDSSQLHTPILGYLTIAESCFFSVALNGENGLTRMQRNERLNKDCSNVQPGTELPNSLLLTMDTTHRVLKLEPRVRAAHLKPMYGVLQRKTPSPYLMKLLESDQGQSFTLPDQMTKSLMISRKVPDENLEKRHAEAILESSEVLARHREEYDLQQARQKEKEWARLKKESEYRAVAEQAKSRKPTYASKPTGDPMPLPKVNGPFDGLPGATVLNAIYQGDRSVVQRINRSYTNMQAAGLKAFFGTYGNEMTDAMADLQKQVRIEDSVAAKYLFDYEKHYRGCLTESPAVFYVIGYQPDMVVTNLLGVEIARHYGGTTKTRYLVNQEFTDVFQKVGKMQPEGLAANITGFLASQGGEDLRKSSMNGVAQMFSKFSCDSHEVKTFEKNLRALF